MTRHVAFTLAALAIGWLAPSSTASAGDDSSAAAPSEKKEGWADVAERVQGLMYDGLVHELYARYEAAEALYEQAAKADPTDPVPHRFLGELYRHHIGRWDLARTAFEKVIVMTAIDDASRDDLSRAVALHGIGKMTIFSNDFEKGVALIEESVKIHPTQLALRNLAVFWNSEGEFKKAREYGQRALAIDPEDPYTRVFCATHLAQDGKLDEALEVLDEVPLDPSMYYNLACIYVETGDVDLALEYLRRHFYEFESNDAVRWYETQEARSDYSYRSIADNPEFLRLTTPPAAPPIGAPEMGPPTWARSEAAKRMRDRQAAGEKQD